LKQTDAEKVAVHGLGLAQLYGGTFSGPLEQFRSDTLVDATNDFYMF